MRRPLTARIVLSACSWLALGYLSQPAEAGPARYDKDSKSFHFTYTFADLPGGVGSVVGTVRKPSPEQEQTVEGLVGRVSAVMAQVTDGRGKIGRLDYVDDIKNADLVISLVGAPASPGWANMRAIEGRPGQIVLYYQSLQGKITQDIVNTAAHEVCHYVFGLADEYVPGNFPGGCPRGGGPGCLMDNYNAGARGFMGRLCLSSDHNVGHTQRTSCKDIVEKFFADRGVTAGDPPGSVVAATNATNATSAAGETTDNRASVVAAVIAQVRAKQMQEMEKGRAGSSRLRTFARTALRDLIERFNRDNPNKVVFGAAENRLLDMIVKAGENVPIETPAELNPRVFARVKAEAERLGREFQSITSQTSRRSRIRSGLQDFFRQLVQLKQVDNKAFAPSEQRRVSDQLASEASRDPKERDLDRLVGVGDRTAQLEMAMAEDIVRVLDSLGEPGTQQRFQFLNRIRGELNEQFQIVGRDSTQFGFRRTQIIAPDSQFGPDLYVLTQGGVYPYATIRTRAIVDFSRLVDRSKMELITPASRQEGDFNPIAARISLPFDQIPAEDPTERRTAGVDVLQAMANVVDQLERDRLENIAILVPPGGLPPSVGEAIPRIRTRFRSGLDVRLDMVLVGAEDLATELRDAVIDSQGSVLTVTDLDEIGAIAQRLKNEQSSGSWVIVPQQGKFSFDQFEALGEQRPPNRIAADPAREVPADEPTREALMNSLTVLEEQIAGSKNDTIPEPVRAKADRALVIIGSLSRIIGQSGNRAQPDSLETLKDEIGRPETTDESRRGPTGLNARLLTRIGQAKDNLNEARTLLLEALNTPRTDAVTQRLQGLARVIQGDKKEIEQSLPDHPELSSLVALGKNLSGLEKLLRDYEQFLEGWIEKSKDDLPVYKRIDRRRLETQRLRLELASIEAATGLSTAAAVNHGANEYRLSRFYAEGNAEFELILGLSRELPRNAEGKQVHPRLRLVSDLGVEVSDSSKIRPDEATSTASLLVWRAATPPLSPAWYTPIVSFDEAVWKRLEELDVHFTFSIGSNRPNIQLITGLSQGKEGPSSGTLRVAEGPAVVEAQVSAGSSVLGASVRGFYQKIARGFEPIDPQEVEFRDDGTDANGNAPGDVENFDSTRCDRAADDGIYTAFIPLTGVDRDTEFRVFVQADTTDGKARYIGLDDPNRGDERITHGDSRPKDVTTRQAQKQSTEAVEGQALKFQRATSVHFRAER